MQGCPHCGRKVEGQAPLSVHGSHRGPKAGFDVKHVSLGKGVAARLNARSYDGLHLGGPSPTHGLDRSLDNSGPDPPPSRMGYAKDALGTGKRYRSAVCAQHRQRGSSQGANGSVSGLPAGSAGSVHGHHPGPVDLSENGPGQVNHRSPAGLHHGPRPREVPLQPSRAGHPHPSRQGPASW
jgi:hypothetical protein